MTRQMLRGIRVNTKQELEERIYKYFDEVNREPVVYHWKYKMDEISEEEAVSILYSNYLIFVILACECSFLKSIRRLGQTSLS